MESEHESSIMVRITSPCGVFDAVSEILDGVVMHLKKMQINEFRAFKGEEQYLSQLVSLSSTSAGRCTQCASKVLVRRRFKKPA